MSFSEKLKEAMRVRNVSQRQLEKESGIRQATISFYCSGKITPKEENKKRIARALDLDENYFEEESEVAKIVVKKEASEIRNTKETKVDVEDVSDIIEVSKELGAIRFKLIQMVEKAREEVKRYNIEDQTFLHRLEFLDSLTDEEAIDMLLKEKQSREHRRRNKNRLILIQELLNSIYIKNPNAFIVRAINSKGDILKTIETLKEDDSLYVGGKNVSN